MEEESEVDQTQPGKIQPAPGVQTVTVEKTKRNKRDMVVKPVKVGAGTLLKSGDFIGRLGTLIVMIVTTINTGTLTVTSFIEGVYWVGGIHAFLLVFVHIPVIVVMIWLMCKARVQAMYRKIRPGKQEDPVQVTDVIEEVETTQTTVVETKKPDKKELKDKMNDRMAGGQKINQAFEAM